MLGNKEFPATRTGIYIVFLVGGGSTALRALGCTYLTVILLEAEGYFFS